MAANVGADFKKYLDPAVVSRLNSIELKARFIVEGFLLGLHKSPYHGFSIEFSQHRPYMQGDAPKDIDWKVYGKTDRFFVKQYEEETNLRAMVLLDCSRSMAFKGEGSVAKFEYARMLAAALSYLMLKQKDAVGLGLYANGIQQLLLPRASDAYLRQILTALAGAAPASGTNTAASLEHIAGKITRRGLIVVISDLFDDLAGVLQALKKFSMLRNEVIVFQVLDPLELSFAFGRDAVFVDLETAEEMNTQPHQLQKAYSDAMQEFTGKIKQECLNAGIDYNLLLTSAPFDKSLFTYLQKRSKLA